MLAVDGALEIGNDGIRVHGVHLSREGAPRPEALDHRPGTLEGNMTSYKHTT
jgi:hypothetical protein